MKKKKKMMMMMMMMIAEVSGMAGAARSRKLGTGERFLTTKIFRSPKMEPVEQRGKA